MRQVNRAIAVIRPRQPFIDWVNSREGGLPGLTQEHERRETRALLIPEPERRQGGRRFIELNFAFIFEDELTVWSPDKTGWPEPRSRELFGEWFDVEIHDMVFDMGDDQIFLEEID